MSRRCPPQKSRCWHTKQYKVVQNQPKYHKCSLHVSAAVKCTFHNLFRVKIIHADGVSWCSPLKRVQGGVWTKLKSRGDGGFLGVCSEGQGFVFQWWALRWWADEDGEVIGPQSFCSMDVDKPAWKWTEEEDEEKDAENAISTFMMSLYLITGHRSWRINPKHSVMLIMNNYIWRDMKCNFW